MKSLPSMNHRLTFKPTLSPLTRIVYHSAGAIRDGEWKLIEQFAPGKNERLALGDDLSEAVNLAVKNPEKVAELKHKPSAWCESVAGQRRRVQREHAFEP